MTQFGKPVDTGLYIETGDEFVQAGVALEVYGVMKLSDLPNVRKTRFEHLQITLDDGTRAAPRWDIVDSAPQYNIRSVAITNGGYEDEVDILYG
ncbi:hypothetical protein ACNJX9_25320 [Bradyrhizobium sp. DASA03076]|uniref:hypothetical protein n=1 Tax=Bradyrhizobium sp. BLXBL-03 TaxID=3395916 RepID=UPI003F6ED0BE